jgi:hypothetical protein
MDEAEVLKRTVGVAWVTVTGLLPVLEPYDESPLYAAVTTAVPGLMLPAGTANVAPWVVSAACAV